MVFLIVIAQHDSAICITTTFDNVAEDSILAPYYSQISKMSIGEYIRIDRKYVVVRIQ